MAINPLERTQLRAYVSNGMQIYWKGGWQKYKYNIIKWPKLMEGIAGVLWGNLSNCTYLGIGNFFLWTIFSGRGHNMVRVQKWLLFFFSPKFQFLAHKSEFCHMTPTFVDGPLLTLGMTVIIVLILVGKRKSQDGVGMWISQHIYECLSGYSSFQAGKRRPLSIWSILIIPDQD